MTTSGSVNYSDTRTDILNDTLILLRVLGSDQTANSSDTAIANRFLNRMMKEWQVKGLQLWATTEAVVFLQYNQTSYSLGSSGAPGGDNASNSYVSTTTSATVSSGTSVHLTSVTGMTVGDYIGIALDTGYRTWSTISSINTGTKVVTLNDSIPSTITSGATVFAYTTKLNRPMDIYDIRRNLNNIDTPVEKVSRQAYFNLPSKTDLGTPISWYYDPQLSSGVLYIWSNPSDVDMVLKMTYLRPLQDFDSSTDTPDLPIEWNNALIYNLAVLLAPVFGKKQDLTALKPMADQLLKEVLDWDNERVSVSFVPQYRFSC